MKKALFCIFALFVCAGVFAQQPVVAVAPFDAISGISAADANIITRVFNIRLGNTNKVILVDRSVIERVLKEHQFQTGDWSNERKTAELGKAFNADWIVRGQLEKFGNRIMVTVEFYDIQTFRFMSGADVRIANADEAYDNMDPLVNKLVETIANTGARSTVRTQSNTTAADFVRIEGGTFQMGNASGGNDDERPVHTVTVKSFSMGKYEVTQKEYQEVMGTNPSNFKGDSRPVENVSWFDAVEYCNKRSVKEGLTPAYRGSGNSISCDWNANGYRLPTEAEWEYAAKGGNRDPMVYTYSGSNSAGAVAWYKDNSGSSTQPVGGKAPNSLGLYDMSGNVWEWCWDWYGAYPSGAQTDPKGASSGSLRVLRGGFWVNSAEDVRAAGRGYNNPNDRGSDGGFRLARNG